MKHVVRKWMIAYEKEEKWLNEMAAIGMNLIHYSWCKYLFEEGKPGEYAYRIEFLKNHSRHPESIAYIRFMEEMGIECVSTYLNWVYFRKKTADGPFDIFTDSDSKIAHISRVSSFMVVLLAVSAFGVGINFIMSLIKENTFAPTNFICAIVALVLFFALAPIYLSYHSKLKKLKADRQLRE